MITVSELIEKLKQYNPDARIVVVGKDGGFDDVTVITELQIALNKNKSRYRGKHDFPTDDEDSVDAILLKRELFFEFKIFT